MKGNENAKINEYFDVYTTFLNGWNEILKIIYDQR